MCEQECLAQHGGHSSGPEMVRFGRLVGKIEINKDENTPIRILVFLFFVFFSLGGDGKRACALSAEAVTDGVEGAGY